MFDLLIIGAGPAGISAAYEAQRLDLKYLVVEKGLIGNTIYHYPVGLTVFSTTNELEFVEGDLKPAREKPTREELLSYYVRFVLDNELNVRWEEDVLSVEKTGENHFTIESDKDVYEAKTVLFAIGAMDYPRRLGVKGEDLPKVHEMFHETYPWVKKRALIVGGGNSAGEAALFLAEEGAETTLAIFRKDWENTDPKQGCIKYWVRDPLQEQLKKRCLNLFFLGKVLEIREKEVVLEDEEGKTQILPNDVVFILIGADADLTMLKNLGVETELNKYGEVPVYDEETFETNISGIYVAGHFTNHRHIKGAIDAPQKFIPKLAKKLVKGNKYSNYCAICNNLTRINPCIYCAAAWRDRSRICVIENNFDILTVEENYHFKGLYHILHGSLSPIRGIGPDELMIRNLFPRLTAKNNEGVEVKEIVLAVNSTSESQMTANYLERLLKPLGVQTSKIEIEPPYHLESEFIQ